MSNNHVYEYLAKRAMSRLEERKNPLWVAIVGGPGAGKSTCANAAVHCMQKMGVNAVHVPMDGFHYTKKDLLARDPENGLSRRGASWTFDAERLSHDLALAKKFGEGSLPDYSREISDPVPDKVKIEKHHQIILVEGNWLLLGHLKDEDSTSEAIAQYGCPVPISEEFKRWESLLNLWDETWFVIPAGGLEEQQKRLIQRSLKTWTASKTKQWGGGTNVEAATRRAQHNDLKNAVLVDCCRSVADVVVDSL